MIAKVKRVKGVTVVQFPDRVFKLKISVREHRRLNQIHWMKKDGLRVVDVLKFV